MGQLWSYFKKRSDIPEQVSDLKFEASLESSTNDSKVKKEQILETRSSGYNGTVAEHESNKDNQELTEPKNSVQEIHTGNFSAALDGSLVEGPKLYSVSNVSTATTKSGERKSHTTCSDAAEIIDDTRPSSPNTAGHLYNKNYDSGENTEVTHKSELVESQYVDGVDPGNRSEVQNRSHGLVQDLPGELVQNSNSTSSLFEERKSIPTENSADPQTSMASTPLPSTSRATESLGTSETEQEQQFPASRKRQKTESTNSKSTTSKFQLNEAERLSEIPIPGKNNSCYMDSTLVSLFLNNPHFIHWIPKGQLKDSKCESVRTLLLDHIANPLYKRQILSSATITKFRTAMTKFKTDYRSSQMDPEEFIRTLFGTILNVPKFYEIEEEGDYVFQTFFNSKSAHPKDVQSLLEGTFTFSDMKLDKIPSPGFIVKLPVTDGRHLLKSVHPNLRISVANFTEPPVDDPELWLSAVLCLSANHYTAFIRESSENLNAPWVFVDSFGFRGPHSLPHLSEFLSSGDRKYVQGMDQLVGFLLSNAYICVYMPKSRKTVLDQV